VCVIGIYIRLTVLYDMIRCAGGLEGT